MTQQDNRATEETTSELWSIETDTRQGIGPSKLIKGNMHNRAYPKGNRQYARSTAYSNFRTKGVRPKIETVSNVDIAPSLGVIGKGSNRTLISLASGDYVDGVVPRLSYSYFQRPKNIRIAELGDRDLSIAIRRAIYGIAFNQIDIDGKFDWNLFYTNEALTEGWGMSLRSGGNFKDTVVYCVFSGDEKSYVLGERD